ncbi:hypothetical protein KKF81_00455 [Candidatus Micrarchaeota archaeon]|nr:hypothetical protein [Candidatus Micrarchaeota archaeon]MBU1165389.1 hypothetical protein [Candidatus Micrarchaeota archaeon]MBU1886212.1 hypothetical protein [Candidatus Micrarchaeota archaeon]
MQIARLTGSVRIDELDKIIQGLDAVAINPDLIESLDEIDLAYHLAKASFDNNKNIGKKLKYEFLLWLSCTRDIKNALKKTAPHSTKDFILIMFSGKFALVHKMIGKKKPLKLKKKGSPTRLEKISLARIIS